MPKVLRDEKRKSCLYVYILTSAILAFTSINSFYFLTSTITFADESEIDDVDISVPISCTLSGTGMNTHNDTVPNGTYRSEIGTTVLHAFCNDTNGFAIYSAGYTNEEVGGTNSDKLVGTSISNNATIVSGLATSAGNPDVSNWAMKLTITQDSGNTTGTNALTIDSAPNVALPSQADPSATSASFAQYHVIPNEYVKVAHKNSATDLTATTGGVKLTTTYATYISKTQSADTYSGKVIYTLVHPYSADAPVALNPNADDISEVKYMQDFSVVSSENRNLIIASMVPEQQYTVKDSRDNKTYTIAKYATLPEDSGSGGDSGGDSPIKAPSTKSITENNIKYNVWMTKNLDLDLNSSITYTNKDTDIGYNTTTGEYDATAWSPTRSTYTATNTQIHEWCQGGTWNSHSQYGYCQNNYTPESYDPGDLYWNGTESGGYYDDWQTYKDSCDMSTSTPVCDQTLNPISTYATSTSSTPQYHLGNYYNWAAALATNDSSVFNSSSSLVEQSICPAGWTLPRVGIGEDTFYSLWSQYGLSESSFIDLDEDDIHDANESALWTSPLYFVAGGYFNGNLKDIGSWGTFWSPSGGGNTASKVDFNVHGSAHSSGGDSVGFGYSVRCILRPVVTSESESGGGGSWEK